MTLAPAAAAISAVPSVELLSTTITSSTAGCFMKSSTVAPTPALSLYAGITTETVDPLCMPLRTLACRQTPPQRFVDVAEISMGFPDRLFHPEPRIPAELRHRSRRIRILVVRFLVEVPIKEVRIDVSLRAGGADHANDAVGELADGDLVAGMADVVHGAAPATAHGRDDAGHNVVHMTEGADLVSVAEDRERFAAHGLTDEARQDKAALPGLARSTNVERADDDSVEAGRLGEVHECRFLGELPDRVLRPRRGLRRDDLGKGLVAIAFLPSSVDLARRHIEEPGAVAQREIDEQVRVQDDRLHDSAGERQYARGTDDGGQVVDLRQ